MQEKKENSLIVSQLLSSQKRLFFRSINHSISLQSIPLCLEAGHQQAELRAPVPEVVDPRHGVADLLVNVRNKVPDDGGPEVTNVKRLGDVWGTELHDNVPDGKEIN